MKKEVSYFQITDAFVDPMALGKENQFLIVNYNIDEIQ